MTARVRLAFKKPGEGWRERPFKSEREAWAFIATLDAEVEVRWLEQPPIGYGHALRILHSST